jgi:hypothetical protein
VAANNKLTLDVLRGHLSCPYLAHLLLTGQEGVKSDYELVLAELEQALRAQGNGRTSHSTLNRVW